MVRDNRPGGPPGSRRLGRIAPAVMRMLLVVSAGCGDGDGLGRRPISGEVTLDGRPLAEGVILFEPAPGAEVGTAVGAPIHRGRFSIARRDGPAPGSYVVRIYASSGVQAPPGPDQTAMAPRPMVERIPERYNRRTTLGVEVTPDGANAFRFPLDSGGTGRARSTVPQIL